VSPTETSQCGSRFWTQDTIPALDVLGTSGGEVSRPDRYHCAPRFRTIHPEVSPLSSMLMMS